MRFIKQSLLAAILVFSLGSCGSYYQLMKSTDTEKKYTEAIKYFYNKDFNKAINLFSDIASVYEGTQKSDTILFYLGKALYNNNAFEESGELMKTYMYNHPRSPFTEESEYVYAMCFYNQSGTHERDQSTSMQAIQAFTEYLNRYPESIKKDDVYGMIDELTRKIYLKRFSNAAIYYKLGKYNAAITSLKATLKQYPEIPYKEEIMYLICKSWFAYAENSVQSRQLDRYMKMMDAYYSYKGEFSENLKQLEELEVMFVKSKRFTEEHGYQAKALSKDRVDIEERLNKISLMKDKRFSAANKEERNKITQEIKFEQEQLRKDRKSYSDNQKEMKYQAKMLMEQKKAAKKLGLPKETIKTKEEN